VAQNSLYGSIRQEAGQTPQANLAWLRKSQRKYQRIRIGSAVLSAGVVVLFVVAALIHQLDQHIIVMSPAVLATGVFNFVRAGQIVTRLRAAEQRVLQRLHG
jgi:hypothetical protein